MTRTCEIAGCHSYRGLTRLVIPGPYGDVARYACSMHFEAIEAARATAEAGPTCEECGEPCPPDVPICRRCEAVGEVEAALAYAMFRHGPIPQETTCD